MTYRVEWSIDVDADSHQAAAEEAKRIMRDQTSTVGKPDVLPPVFEVTDAHGNARMVELP